MEFEFKYRKPLEKKWLVIYVRPRWEKKVDQLLQEQGIESFCPTTTTENQWADRKKMVTRPLFTGYVFVKIDDRDLTKVRYTMGVMNYIYFMGKPAVIRDAEVEQLKEMVKNYNNLQVVGLNELSAGDKVRIRSGLFHNQEGNIIKIQGKNVLMSFDHLDCALVTYVPVSQVVKTIPQNTLLCNRH
ncbi:UpxY family transcription antiterminator [Pedobacter sp. B4-66]|uniref:UpxY family transcription antiterminator n=1 Tax=Pedobacter sp. B4-66 TaxID=2817280 RepID=UPI001BDB392C|nr:UpxY family transcription antiterminator [Pedobacter sp. B4-66]